jgi:hypothetical protein
VTGGTACEASTWVSDSAASCKVSGGAGGGWPLRRGRGMPVVVSAGLQQGSLTGAWCYNAAAVRAVGSLTNGPASGSVFLTLSGTSFGFQDVSAVISLGHVRFSSFEQTFWMSDSAVRSKFIAGLGKSLSLVLSSAQQQGLLTQALSFNVPKLSSFDASRNRPVSASVYVIVSGYNFGSILSASGRIQIGYRESRTSAESTEWISDSWAKTKCSAVGVDRGLFKTFHTMIMTIILNSGSLTTTWCYNVPTISSIATPNGPTSGAVPIQIQGTMFGSRHFSVRARLGRGSAFEDDMTGGTACEASTWVSDSAASCKVSGGAGGGWPLRRGRGMPVVVSAGLQQGSLSDAWCYNAAAVRAVGSLTNGPASGAVSAIFTGSSFGSRSFSVLGSPWPWVIFGY